MCACMSPCVAVSCSLGAASGLTVSLLQVCNLQNADSQVTCDPNALMAERHRSGQRKHGILNFKTSCR